MGRQTGPLLAGYLFGRYMEVISLPALRFDVFL